MKTEPNDTAYPLPELFTETGLTKREYFAAMAMQGLIAKINVHEYKDLAKYSVNAADALIAALNDQTQEGKG